MGLWRLSAFMEGGRDTLPSHTSAATLPIELSVGWASRHTCVAMEIFLVDGVLDTTLSLALFKNVKNATDLKSKYLNQVALLDAGKRQYPPYLPTTTKNSTQTVSCSIDRSTSIDSTMFRVSTAVNRCVHRNMWCT